MEPVSMAAGTVIGCGIYYGLSKLFARIDRHIHYFELYATVDDNYTSRKKDGSDVEKHTMLLEQCACGERRVEWAPKLSSPRPDAEITVAIKKWEQHGIPPEKAVFMAKRMEDYVINRLAGKVR